MNPLPLQKLNRLLPAMAKTRVLVVGDIMLDHYLWGRVVRISPEAPVPIVEMADESYMPGGAANVARNLTALGAQAELFGVIGPDAAGRQIKHLLREQNVECQGLITARDRPTSLKTRIIAHQQQVVRVDREKRGPLALRSIGRLLKEVRSQLNQADALIVGDYGKGVVTQELLNALKQDCARRGIWLSLDPKPVHQLDLSHLSLITPNRKEAFELAGRNDGSRGENPMQDRALLEVSKLLLHRLQPALLLITLGEQGMLLCQRGHLPFHIPTVAQEVFDVSGAGDTVIASFTLAIAAGASPIEAAVFSNHAAGIVVGKKGTATASPADLRLSLKGRP
ncbi:MAG TPA: PfkB family carbohydrate kinase [Candidatus Paceibacterota bacterium]|nr:PfkB family carbohydrate kinase [Verrucomicrobiota bacterium]HRY52100.1 PfkB family carbohydrate kinase [Candidatus Paceibacterota bacterium]